MQRIIIDVTETLATGKWTGIERVVRHLTMALQASVGSTIPVTLVAAIEGRFFALNAAGLASFARPASGNGMAANGRLAKAMGRFFAPLPRLLIRVQAHRKAQLFKPRLAPLLDQEELIAGHGDVVLLIDSYWSGVTSVTAARRARRAGARIIAMIYDLIPITHPQYMTPVLRIAFPRYVMSALRISDGAIAISNYSADMLRQWLGSRLSRLPIGWFHLGSDPVAGAPSIRTGPVTEYAMIGTIEPRKGHDVVLDAFERSRAAGRRRHLTIVGKQGWASPVIQQRLEAMTAAGIVQHIGDADDARLAAILQQTDAVIMASKIEGFGLPIVEALALDIPVIASDIPIFREIAGDTAITFDPADANALVEAMDRLEAAPLVWRERARRFHWSTWNDAGQQFVAQIEQMLHVCLQRDGAVTTGSH